MQVSSSVTGDSKPLSAGSTAMISNALDPPPDEGIKKCAQQLAVLLAEKGAIVYRIRQDAPFVARKLLASPQLLRTLRKNRVRVVVYVPTQSATLGSLVRSTVLRLLVGVKVVLLALQARDLRKVPPVLATYLRPDLVLTPSPSMLRAAERCGLKAAEVPLGVDLDRFQPVSPGRKLELREKYALPAQHPIVLHVGHASRRRGLDWITRLSPDIVRIVVIGRSLGLDQHVVEVLRGSGIRVFDRYMPEIHELYQLADVYAFPVRHEQAAIAAPLSVLEAMACNLPVVSTSYGALPQMLVEGTGLFFTEDELHFRAGVAAALDMPRDEVRTREQVLRYGWTAAGDAVLQAAIDLCRRT